MSTSSPFANHHHWISPFDSARFAEFYNPSMRQKVAKISALGDIYTNDNGDFRWKCDVSGYLPEEINVDMDGDELVVSAMHEEIRDGQSDRRQLERRVRMPPGIDKNVIKCHIDHHCHLLIAADQAGVYPVDPERESKKLANKPAVMDRFGGGSYSWPAYTYQTGTREQQRRAHEREKEDNKA
ncbi:small HSP21-like protein [Aphelenchoides avenae]|nr:small HSP21-like protein [Aphelenchus avenae]